MNGQEYVERMKLVEESVKRGLMMAPERAEIRIRFAYEQDVVRAVASCLFNGSTESMQALVDIAQQNLEIRAKESKS